MPHIEDTLPKTAPRTGQAAIPAQQTGPSAQVQAASNRQKAASGLLPVVSLSAYSVPDALLQQVFGGVKEDT